MNANCVKASKDTEDKHRKQKHKKISKCHMSEENELKIRSNSQPNVVNSNGNLSIDSTVIRHNKIVCDTKKGNVGQNTAAD